MFMRSSIPTIGLLSEDYFLYYEEIDYARRLKYITNYDIGWCKASIVRHKGGLSTAGRSDKNKSGSWLSNYHENISTLLYTFNHHKMLLPVAAGFRLVMKLATLVIFKRWQSFNPLVKVYWDFFSRKNWHPNECITTTKLRIWVSLTSKQIIMPVPRYIELIIYKTYADLRTETEKTYIGFFWWVIDPIMYMCVLLRVRGFVE
ncbi:MAG: hypothetical protein R3F37_09200 [Candidatus Competibacteraceae bacterium]